MSNMFLATGSTGSTASNVGYEQVDAWTLKKLAANSPRRNYEGRAQAVTDTQWQHFEEIAKDHQNGVFAGTNDLAEKIGGERPIGFLNSLRRTEARFCP